MAPAGRVRPSRLALAAGVLGAGVLACSDGPPETPEPEPALSAAEAVAQAEAAQQEQVSASGEERSAGPAELAPVPGADPVEIVLVWQGIGNLHRSWFSSGAAVELLSKGFAGHVAGPANVYVRHDAQEYLGSIRLQLRPDTLRVEVPVEGEVVDLAALAPITVALARYRSHVGGNYDLRVESFHVGIESFRGPHSCIFGVAGEPPPDGSLVSPCVQLDGAEVCGTTVAGGVRFEAAAVKKIRRCLDQL